MTPPKIKRDDHPCRCTAPAATPSAPNINPAGRCRNIIAADLWCKGQRTCATHGGKSAARARREALAKVRQLHARERNALPTPKKVLTEISTLRK